MVVPLIVGASRVVGTTKAARLGQNVRRSGSHSKRGSNLRGKNMERKMLRYAHNNSKARDREDKSKLTHKVIGKAKKLIKQARAGSVAMTIFWTAIAFYTAQLGFWILGIAGISMEIQSNVIGAVIPDILPEFISKYIPDLSIGFAIYLLSWICIAFIGICTMVYALIFFISRKVSCLEGWKGIIFIICLTCYLVMFINLFPWFVVWIVSVVYMQSED